VQETAGFQFDEIIVLALGTETTVREIKRVGERYLFLRPNGRNSGGERHRCSEQPDSEAWCFHEGVLLRCGFGRTLTARPLARRKEPVGYEGKVELPAA
jgi:hypothetical protein